MGMVTCPIHGLTHFSLCCVHVADAVEAGRMERAFVDIDGWTDTNVLCVPCHDRALALIRASTTSDADPRRFDFEFDRPMVPYCHSCLIEWYARTGQGNLSGAIAAARKNAGLEPGASNEGTEQKS